MKEGVDDVMRRWIESEQLAIEHMRNPGDWMPVSRFPMQTAEGPLDPLARQARLNMGVAGDVVRVVVINELVRADWKKNGECEDKQRARDNPSVARRKFGLCVRNRRGA